MDSICVVIRRYLCDHILRVNMANNLRQRFKEELTTSLSAIDGIEEEMIEENVEELIDEYIHIKDPEAGRFYEMTGRLMDAKRKEPIRVTLTNPTKAEVTSILSSAIMSASWTTESSDLVTTGIALLTTYSVVAEGRSVNIGPDIALTYAVGWDISNSGEENVHRKELESQVIQESRTHEKKKEMNENDVENALWDLRQMGCISCENMIEFKEKCTMIYK